MKPNLFNLGLATALALLIAACGGGGGIAGVGGSGFVSSGSVTGFGSVFVNGVEFETTSSTFDIDDTSASELALKVGMVVQVSGTINPDGITGTATSISYEDDIEGPVSNISENADQNIKTFTIMGTTVKANSADTVFDGTDYVALTNNNVVEVSGYYDADNVLQATYIELKSSTFNALSDEVEIKGTISGLSGTSFMINSVNVNAVAANLSDLSNGLVNGAFVEVKGLYNAGSNTINATEVEAEDNNIGDSDSSSIEGYVTRYVSNSDFDINGYQVNAANAVFNPSQLANRLSLGAKVEAEGSVSNGVMTADYVEIRGGEVKIMATTNGTVNTANGTFEINILATTITVAVTSATSTEDDKGTGADDLDLSTIVAGDKFEIRGFETTTGYVIATKVKRMDSTEVIDTLLQGYVTAHNSGFSVTVLGVIFPVDVNTEFYDDSEPEVLLADHNAFITIAPNNTSVVKIKDKESGGNPVGTADEVELETL